MFGLLTAIVLTAKEIIKEKTEPVVPKGTRFDWDAYWKDVEDGMSTIEQIEKRKRGDYMTTKPAAPKWYELPMDTVVDIKRYEHDKEIYGERMTESWRKNGQYRQVKK